MKKKEEEGDELKKKVEGIDQLKRSEEKRRIQLHRSENTHDRFCGVQAAKVVRIRTYKTNRETR